MKKIFNWKILLFLIILLGFIFRVYQLGQVPKGLYADEAAFGYNAYSLLKTGKDEYGKFFPIVLKSFGDYKGAFYAYADIPFVLLLGLTPIAVRFPSIIFDTLTIFAVFLLIKELLGDRKIALISSLLYAISPWSVNISRTTGDVISAMLFTILMTYWISRLCKKFEFKLLILIIFSGLISIIAYAPFRFFVVIIPFLFFITSVRRIKTKINFNKLALIIMIAFLVFGALYTLIASTARFGQISIFSTPQTQLVLNEQIREDQFTPVSITRLFHNKVINYSRTILKNAQAYFTFDFLALSGGLPQREKIPDMGLFYIWEIPFLLAGLYLVIKSRKRNEIFLLLWWILLLFPSFFTFDEVPNVHRTIIILPAICAIIAIGIKHTFEYKSLKNKKIYSIVGIIFTFIVISEFSYFYHQYLVHLDNHKPWIRGASAYAELIPAIEKHYPDYKKIVITKSIGSPYIYLLFSSKYDPKKYQFEGSPRDLGDLGFDKYLFVQADCPIEEIGSKNLIEGTLFVNAGNCNTLRHNEYEGKLLQTINWSVGIPAFKLVEYSSTNSAKIGTGEL